MSRQYHLLQSCLMCVENKNLKWSKSYILRKQGFGLKLRLVNPHHFQRRRHGQNCGIKRKNRRIVFSFNYNDTNHDFRWKLIEFPSTFPIGLVTLCLSKSSVVYMNLTWFILLMFHLLLFMLFLHSSLNILWAFFRDDLRKRCC